MKNNEKFYYRNEKYTNVLENQNQSNFKKIVDTIKKYTKEDSHILDVGCGSGVLLSLVDGRENKLGVEISDVSIERCKRKGLNCYLYDGDRIPFEDNKFDLVFSFNVLEHVDDVVGFLSEKIRVIKNNGYLVVACPNFLSITSEHHWHTTGLRQRISNLLVMLGKIVRKEYNFDKMKTISRDDFRPDDDACNVVNPIDIYKWSIKNNLKIEYWSSQSVYKESHLVNFIDRTMLKIFFGSCFFVFKKNNEKIAQ